MILFFSGREEEKKIGKENKRKDSLLFFLLCADSLSLSMYFSFGVSQWRVHTFYLLLLYPIVFLYSLFSIIDWTCVCMASECQNTKRIKVPLILSLNKQWMHSIRRFIIPPIVFICFRWCSYAISLWIQSFNQIYNKIVSSMFNEYITWYMTKRKIKKYRNKQSNWYPCAYIYIHWWHDATTKCTQEGMNVYQKYICMYGTN